MAAQARPGARVLAQGLIRTGEAYHYSHHSTPALLPAWRVIYADADQTRLYFDPRTGELIDYVDAPARGFRWRHLALHRFDFAGMDTRPLWDALLWLLMTGVSLVCLLGVWMGVRRLRPTAR